MIVLGASTLCGKEVQGGSLGRNIEVATTRHGAILGRWRNPVLRAFRNLRKLTPCNRAASCEYRRVHRRCWGGIDGGGLLPPGIPPMHRY
jgi:hypothetical protein